jgi:hypothetical protein
MSTIVYVNELVTTHSEDFLQTFFKSTNKLLGKSSFKKWCLLRQHRERMHSETMSLGVVRQALRNIYNHILFISCPG